MYLTIDFEDFSHNLKRGLGICNSSRIRSAALWSKYRKINNIFKRSKSEIGKYGTFFCTAYIAEQEPDLIRKIASDGHEIGCHYYYHDNIIDQDLITFNTMIKRAKYILENVIDREVLGFRAPNFAINKKSPEQYKIVEDNFKYDSSFFCNTQEELLAFKKRMKIENLQIIPIFSHSFFNINLKLGGSYLKLLPLIYSQYMIKYCKKNKFHPQIYLHPHEFGKSMEFFVQKKSLQKLGFVNRIIWSLRQYQWLYIGNRSLEKKINRIILNDSLSGKLSNLLMK